MDLFGKNGLRGILGGDPAILFFIILFLLLFNGFGEEYCDPK